MVRIKSRGFTLIEIIVTIGILSVLSAIIILNVNNNLKKSNDENYQTFVDKVKSAANVFIAANPVVEKYAKMDKYYIITVDDLEAAGLISTSTLIDPESQKALKYLEENNPKRYIKVYDDEKVNNDKSNATLIEYPVNNMNEFQVYISYVMNGFGSTCKKEKVGVLKNVTLCKPTDDNADFIEWYEDQELTKPITYSEGKYYKTDKNVTLYAKWKKNKGPKIDYLNLVSTNNDQIFKLNTINLELKLTDVYNSDIKFCLQTSNNMKSCVWKDYNSIYKEENVKLDITNYSGNKITYYAFAKNEVAEEDESKIAILSKEYQVYKACSYTKEGKMSDCVNACSAKCVKDGNVPTCKKTRSITDKYIESKDCGSQNITASCNADKNCCDSDSIKKIITSSACSASCGSGTKTETTKIVSIYDNNILCGETTKTKKSCNTGTLVRYCSEYYTLLNEPHWGSYDNCGYYAPVCYCEYKQVGYFSGGWQNPVDGLWYSWTHHSEYCDKSRADS